MKVSTSYIIIAVGIVVSFGIYATAHVQKYSTSNSSVAVSLAVGELAPSFTVQSIDGKSFSLAEHKGKPVIIFGMFGGCGECIPTGETLNKIQKDYAAKGVSVLAIDILNGEPLSTLEQYRDYIKADFPLVVYSDSVVRAYNLTAPEITYVIDANGNIADINLSALNYQQYKDELDKII
ncbi:MAG: TlpA family protein disulfide reductase [Patescibacteria group bacterium]|nr:TlpA family protein disulfide reductase [Patescibacteria group bacterium]